MGVRPAGVLARLALAAPVLAGTLALGVLAVGERVEPGGGTGLAPENLAEAAGMGNAAEVVRRLRLGENPGRVYVTREFVISPQITRVTTVEAALWSRRLEMIQLLDAEGAIVDGRTRRELACLAADLDLPEIADYLGGGSMPACVPMTAMERLVARTAGEDKS